jgi:hypothetical protein
MDHTGQQNLTAFGDTAAVLTPSDVILSLLQCMDHTGQQNLTAFGDTGEAIMGRKAEDFADTQAMGEAAYEAMVQQRMNAVS